ncbi:methyltransferase [Klosneuvirus KNV1]|uniref:Methyltransferase n=1 Tax=Klosneuvirus KNV1 TaxID=1977640 RepID=A0A1V0SJ68_9VIRU|nr:methyltransferase [Klosneuvirus KNV1]
MKIAIIGSHGYIGSFLYKQFKLKSQYEIHGFTKTNRNIEQDNLTIINGRNIPETIIKLFDIVIYTAGISGFESCSKYSFEQLVEENVEDIYEIAKKMNNSQILIYLSTGVVYEGCKTYPCTEKTKINEEQLSIYGKTYYMREQKLQMYDKGPICIGLRLGTVIGVSPIQNITRVYIAMLRDAFLKGLITVQNSDCMRPILDIWDLYYAIERVIDYKEKIKKNNIYNLSSFNASMIEIATQISAYTGDTINIIPNKSTINFMMDNTLFSIDFDFVFKGTHNKLIEELINNITYICKDDIKKTVYQSTCRICKSNDVMSVLDLHEQPLANSFTTVKNNLKRHPLCLERCRNCNHTQLNYIVPPEEMFSHYLYASGTSKTIMTYFAWLAKKCTDESNRLTNNILELASNDGTQLDCFKQLGWNTYGIDPALNISDIALKKGHNISIGFWGIDKFNIPTPDIIIAQNVFAHVPDPVKFLKACVDIMTNTTKLYIQTSQCNMYITGEFDTIYHEHLSFYTAHSFKKVAELTNLIITGLEITPIHGNSFLVTMQKPYLSNIDHCKELYDRIEYEKRIGMTDDFFWIRYRNKSYKIVDWIRNNYITLKDNYKLVAYGAAAKGMTLLNHINDSNISFIVDDSPLKQNTYSPGLNIPVFSTLYLKQNTQPLAILILAWNFFDEIIKNIITLRKGLKTLIIRPFPNQIIYELTDNGLNELVTHTISFKNIESQTLGNISYYPEKIVVKCVNNR